MEEYGGKMLDIFIVLIGWPHQFFAFFSFQAQAHLYCLTLYLVSHLEQFISDVVWISDKDTDIQWNFAHLLIFVLIFVCNRII